MVDQDEVRAGFEELAVPLLKRLYNFAAWLCRDPAEADDLVQEAYVRALKGFASFQPGTNFSAWMFRILRNIFLNSRSSSRMVQHVSIGEEGDEALLLSTPNTPESILLAASTQEQIQAALERLPVAHREVIILCDVEEMKYREIADVLNVPVGTVMSRVARARKALRALLAEPRLSV